MKPEPTRLLRWGGRHGLIALALLLAVTLTPLGWIQWRQVRLLDADASRQVDSIMWQAYQLESELHRLHGALAGEDPASPDADALRERYEVFLSRMDLLASMPRRDLLEKSFEYTNALALLRQFVASAEPAFADAARLLDDAAARQPLLDQMDRLRLPLSELTREANRAVSRHLDERNQQLRDQGLLVIGLAALQIGLLLLSMGLLVRHIRHQQQQYARLQKLSENLAEARDQAEAANRGKTAFLANMSHEIRTPFQGLLGMLNLLDEAQLTGQQRDHLQTARDSALHLLGVLNDILDVSTMESGTLKLSLAPVRLQGVMDEVRGLMQVAAHDKGLRLELYAAADLPEWVLADATRLRQILFNLLSNAIKFTPEGEVIAELTRAGSGRPGVVFTVRDTGVGMDESTLAQLFTRFYQADSSLRRRIGGTGLGLEISRNLARLMGGDIEVSSQPGVGSTFSVYLALAATRPPAEEPGRALHADSSARKLRVLVAEDHPINLKYMSILLDRMGHSAAFCENGQQAIELLQREPFDVVLLDYHMPVLDGLATTEAIRRLEGPTARVPVVLVTADVVNDTRKRAMEAGVNAFASKPLQADDLRAAFARCGLLEPAADADDAADSMPSGWLNSQSSGLVPLSTYELAPRLPVRMSDPQAPAALLVDVESYTEIVSMMPAEGLDELLGTVFDAPQGTVHVLAEAIRSGDREAAAYNAHKLKGSCMLMGFRLLVQTSSQIEKMATQSTHPVPTGLARQLLREAERTRDALKHFASPVSA